MRWSYGITTVPGRRDTLLPRTLTSLRAGGFGEPRLFVDGATNLEAKWWEDTYHLEVTTRWPTIRAHGNWVLSMTELYIREPNAERYAIFQDDMVCYQNLRGYLDRTLTQEKCYWNLYTFPQNLQHGRGAKGWYPSNQKGLGAVALVMTREGVISLLTHRHLVERPMDAHRGWKNVDGGIVESHRKMGWREYVHNPTLVQHIGQVSEIKKQHRKHMEYPPTEGFLGEEYDALKLF